ncbi:hypothetical protein LEMLEM_LOCUS6875 [Lemmus lemmus]
MLLGSTSRKEKEEIWAYKGKRACAGCHGYPCSLCSWKMSMYLSYEKLLCYSFGPWIYLSLCISSNFKTIAIREHKGNRQRMPSRNSSNLSKLYNRHEPQTGT